MARGIETKCLHLEEEEGCSSNYGAVSYPIYQNGITESTLRLSVGIEDVKDLLCELETVFREIEGEAAWLKEILILTK